MAKPENSAPPRPPAVPAAARFEPAEPGFEWVVGALDAEGRRHGTYRSWTRTGVLHGECRYDHGHVHGKNINFHPDGTIASEAEWVDGVVMDSAFYRSDGPTTEPFAQAAANVWAVRYYTRDGKTNYTIRYFARDERECGPDGEPLPPRPKSVCAEARWFPDMDRWVDGEIERGTNVQVGRWRWWSRDGVLRHEEARDPRGEIARVAVYRVDGTPETRTTRDDGGEVREYFFDDGTRSSRIRIDTRGRQVEKASWLPEGTLEADRVRVFDGDRLASVTERATGGVLRFEARGEGPAMACVLYAGDGRNLAAAGVVEDGLLHGRWRVFDDDGTIRREVDVTPLAIEHEPTGEGLAWTLGEALFCTDEPGFDPAHELAGIEAEPWAETSGAYELDVERFPRLLLGLTAPDPLARDYALGTIAGEIVHDGTVYPATARVLPYLARLLAHPRVDRAAVLAVIHEVVDALAGHDGGTAGATPDDAHAIADTARAVAVAWPHVYAGFATATVDERLRILAMARSAAGAKADLAELARHDSDPVTRARAFDALVARSDFTAADAQPSLHDKDPLVRGAAAIAVALRLGADTPREAVHALDEAIRNWRDLARRYDELPVAELHVLAHAALAAGAIGTADARSLAPQLCAPIDEVDGRSALAYGRGLLQLAFGSGARPFAKRFLEILDTLARSRQFWELDLEARDLLDAWNLPGSRRELAALVAELHAVPEPEAILHERVAG